MTQVKFLLEKDSTDVFAFFPNTPYTTDERKANLFTCYAPIGQHSACHIDYANECKEATHIEYIDLLQELIKQGYNDLQIMNRQTRQCHRPPTKAEIKFGEGATHYRYFTFGEIGIRKNGMWKKWFKADDGLRYYTN